MAGRQSGLWETFSLGENELGYVLGFINLVHDVFLEFPSPNTQNTTKSGFRRRTQCP